MLKLFFDADNSLVECFYINIFELNWLITSAITLVVLMASCHARFFPGILQN